jgi:uncharacterized protein YdeI (YjbR/CyaY-like superfamily)
MEITETTYAATREEWRDWLARHHEEASEIWLVSYRKAVGKPGVAYNDAVEEALCFGWIDSTRKRFDDESSAQRYTPRRPGSSFSQINKERLARMIDRGRVAPAVLAALTDSEDDIRPESFRVPADIEVALRSEPEAWRHWESWPPGYRRIRAAYVDSARDRDHGEFRKRLDNLVRKTAAGKQFGYGIESYY